MENRQTERGGPLVPVYRAEAWEAEREGLGRARPEALSGSGLCSCDY